jgi:hypothetical protein
MGFSAGQRRNDKLGAQLPSVCGVHHGNGQIYGIIAGSIQAAMEVAATAMTQLCHKRGRNICAQRLPGSYPVTRSGGQAIAGAGTYLGSPIARQTIATPASIIVAMNASGRARGAYSGTQQKGGVG